MRIRANQSESKIQESAQPPTKSIRIEVLAHLLQSDCSLSQEAVTRALFALQSKQLQEKSFQSPSKKDIDLATLKHVQESAGSSSSQCEQLLQSPSKVQSLIATIQRELPNFQLYQAHQQQISPIGSSRMGLGPSQKDSLLSPHLLVAQQNGSVWKGRGVTGNAMYSPFKPQFTSPEKNRRISSEEQGAADLHANEQINSQSPIPKPIPLHYQQAKKSVQSFQGFKAFERVKNLYQPANLDSGSQQIFGSPEKIRSTAALSNFMSNPHFTINQEQDFTVTPPPKGQSASSLGIESTQARTTLMTQSREKLGESADRESVPCQNMMEIFNQHHLVRSDFGKSGGGHQENIFSTFNNCDSKSLLSATTTPVKNLVRNPHQFAFTEGKCTKNLFGNIKQSSQETEPPLYDHFEESDLHHLQPSAMFHHQASHHFNSALPPYDKHLDLVNRPDSPNFASDINLGEKRARDPSSLLSAQNILNEDHPAFMTPFQPSKRKRLDPYSRSEKQPRLGDRKTDTKEKKKIRKFNISQADESGQDSDGEDDDEDELNSPVHRKKRGLKILSVKVRELVEKKGQTTYKDVANDLIMQLRESKKGEDLSDLDDTYDDDEDMTEESPDKKQTASGSKKEPVEGNNLQKWEKNVRRRVYDALNVLYAAGVLRKEGKHVSCDPKVIQMTREIKQELCQHMEEQSEAPKSVISRSEKKSRNSAYEMQLQASIQELKMQIEEQKRRNEEKRESLNEKFQDFVCYKHLLARNEQDDEVNRNKEKYHLPIILLATQDSPENEIYLTYGPSKKALNVSTRKPLTVIGDLDVLHKLKFNRTSMSFLQEKLPIGLEHITSVLSSKHLKNVIVEDRMSLPQP